LVVYRDAAGNCGHGRRQDESEQEEEARRITRYMTPTNSCPDAERKDRQGESTAQDFPEHQFGKGESRVLAIGR
jgi:hypothetical protein